MAEAAVVGPLGRLGEAAARELLRAEVIAQALAAVALPIAGFVCTSAFLFVHLNGTLFHTLSPLVKIMEKFVEIQQVKGTRTYPL